MFLKLYLYRVKVRNLKTRGNPNMVDTTFNVGTQNQNATPYSTSLYLNSYYTRDIYQFNLSGTGSINALLYGMQSDGDDADLSLYRDNGNGYFDSGDTYLTGSSRSGNLEDSINYQSGAGTYFLTVNRYAQGGSSLPYSMKLSATTSPYASSSTAPNLLAKEITVNTGNLSYDRTFYGSVGNNTTVNDTADTYAFRLGNYEGVNIRLTGLSSDADIRLIRDSNNNRIVNSGEVLRSSTLGSTSSELISAFETTGNYYLQVFQYGAGSTNYTLTFDRYATSYA